jgi:hypothetical protein
MEEKKETRRNSTSPVIRREAKKGRVISTKRKMEYN